MSDYTDFREIGVSLDGLVATVEIRRAPHNFFDSALIAEIGEAFERLDADPACRTIVLAAEGRSFCAGADCAISSARAWAALRTSACATSWSARPMRTASSPEMRRPV